MGRIKKTPSDRHRATESPAIASFVEETVRVSLHQLPLKLDSFPRHWPLPRGDLYHWIPLLDRFDHILEIFVKEYGLNEGPQSQPFERRLLEKGDAEAEMPYPSGGAQKDELETLNYAEDGDRELIEAVVSFTRLLLEHCGNRSLYASSGHINDLLHTTDLSLLSTCLKLGLRLAQRYQVARYKNNATHMQQALLSNHYNFNLDNLHKIALPFPKPSASLSNLATSTPGKGKDKAGTTSSFNPSDLVAIAKQPASGSLQKELSTVSVTYYDQPKTSSSLPPTEAVPPTPTPVRRTSTLGPSRERPLAPDRTASSNDTSDTPLKSRESESANAPKTFQLPASRVAEVPGWQLVREGISNVPKESHYDMLNRIRIAKAFSKYDTVSAQNLLQSRLLAVANLAYAVGESKFQEKLGLADAEEPRKFHLAQQLCDLLQPDANAQKTISLDLEIVVLQTLEAMVRLKHKWSEVVEALAITVNHGVLYYELRKAISSLSAEKPASDARELKETEWRIATLALVDTVSQANPQAKYAERMLAAGVMDIEIEVLTLRTSRAERLQEKVLGFLDAYIHNIATSFQTLANAKGLEILSDLASHLVQTSLQNVRGGNGMPASFKSKVVDYDISYYEQAALRSLFKFIVHLFDHNSGVHDRELRNLLDSPPMLGALRTVVGNASVFGSNVWSAATNTVTNFIHNEPTSYQVIAEAGLAKGILESITQTSLPDELPADFDSNVSFADPEPLPVVGGEIQHPTVSGILPVGETICDIPAAFGAICLNEAGMKLFQASGALDKFFDVFVSPAHVIPLEDEGLTAATVGNAFDELSRHHPPLKDHILAAVLRMVKRVKSVTDTIAEQSGVGSKIWLPSSQPDEFEVAGGMKALAGQPAVEGEQSTAVTATDLKEEVRERVSATPYISACFKFLDGFFHNSSMCQQFCVRGGGETVLDLATSSSNPGDVVAFAVFNKVALVVKRMCEEKPHLILPSIMSRSQRVLEQLKPITDSEGSYLAKFVDPSTLPEQRDSAEATSIIKSLCAAHILSHVLGRSLAPLTHQTHRHASGINPLFMTLNFTDVYVSLVTGFSRLHSACLWENHAVKEKLPEDWETLSDPRPYAQRRAGTTGFTEFVSTDYRNGAGANSKTPTEAELGGSKVNVFAYKNSLVIRFLLSQAPMGIESFFANLAQVLTPKRTSDANAKQHAGLVADTLAKCMLKEIETRKLGDLAPDNPALNRYLFSVLTATTRLLIRNSTTMESFGTKEAMSLVLNKFYLADGFEMLQKYLEHFMKLFVSSAEINVDDGSLVAREGMNCILGFYNQVVRSKCINESSQSNMISVRGFDNADFFVPSQFLVEIRKSVLGTLDGLWHDDTMAKTGLTNIKFVIETLKYILKAEGEERALKRAEKATRRINATEPDFSLKFDSNLQKVKDAGYTEDLAKEAIYRCNNHEVHSLEYAALRADHAAPRLQLPPVADKKAEDESALQRQQSIDMPDAPAETTRPSSSSQEAPSSDDQDMSEDENPGSLGRLSDALVDGDLAAMTGLAANTGLAGLLGVAGASSAAANSTLGVSARPPAEDTKKPFVTIDDLNEARETLREDLIDRCLEVLSAQPSMTFELADLIQAAVAKSGEAANPRADIGNTLVSSLLSLQAEEPGKETGIKISAYAHLVALILQDRDFFDSTLDELKDNFELFVNWIQLAQDQKAEDTPWIEMLLLIIERVLSEDEQPVEIEWNPPSADNPLKPQPVPQIPEPVVSDGSRNELFNALIDLLPKIGKNSSLALSIMRVFVVLTRRRSFATRLGEKLNMSRLFLMIRQLSSSVGEKLQGAFLLVLRHLVEDEATIRQIMKTDIKTTFEGGSRSMRSLDTSTFTRNLHYLVLRDPEIFVSVVQEMLEIPRFDGHPHRAQALALKPTPPPEQRDAATEDKPTEEKPIDGPNASETKPVPDSKPPTSETTDGVVSFLLRELSTYREVEDKPPAPKKDTPPSTSDGKATSSGDVEMSDAAAPVTTPTENKKDEKLYFKAEDHTIYIYRCFLLQCLSELLACYSRTKLEFINFSRKPETQPATPSKPRSGTLNYLLNVLIPVGTLEHREDTAHRKRQVTSNWATMTLVSLCSQTQEKPRSRVPSMIQAPEEDPDLLFVRRFVIEHALRSFKEATASSEALDQRYSRLLALGDLFDRMLNSKPERHSPINAANFDRSQQQLGRLMYEKNLIAALTSSIAELDLNFPNAKRAVKHILVPLKTLTDLAVDLSQRAELSSAPGTSTDEDDIGAETSASEEESEDEREQTPDLFRNSALGILNPDEEGSSDEDDDDEDDDDEMEDYEAYDEEMGFDDEETGDPGDVVSDEDEDIDGMDGMEEMGDIEGLSGDHNLDVEILDEDDDDEDEDDSDDDEEEGDDDDADDFGNGFDEVTGDDENASLGEDPEGWEGEGEEFEEDDVGSAHGGPLDQLANVLAGNDPAAGVVRDGVIHVDMTGGEDEFFDDEMPPGEEDEDDEEADYEAELNFEPEGEDEEMDDMGEWQFAGQPAAAMQASRHHHHHRGGLHGFLDFVGPHDGHDLALPYGSNRYRGGTGPARGDDEGTNPLLQRDRGAAGFDTEPGAMPPFLSRVGDRGGRTRDQIIGEMVARLNRVDGGNGPQRFSLDIDPRAFPGGIGLPPIFAINNAGRGPPQIMDIDSRRPWRDQLGYSRDTRGGNSSDEAHAVHFRPMITAMRWMEEARILFASKHHEKATRIVASLLRLLVPPAMEAKRIHDKEEAEKRAAEEKKREEERKKAEAEKAEREEREKKEREEKEAKEREEAATKAREEAEAAEQAGETEDVDQTSMEGVEQDAPSTEAPAEETPAAERVFIEIRGRQLDITDLGIDRDYLEALPEEYREDVVMGQLTQHREQQRAEARQTSTAPDEISREFLDALPPEMQQELLAQEARARRQREQAEARRAQRAAQGVGEPAAAPQEMDNSDFFATLDPAFRQQILMEQDENLLNVLPEELQREARELIGHRAARPRGPRDLGDGPRVINVNGAGGYQRREPGADLTASTQRARPVVQMLDKPGVATLLRLMFVSLHHRAKSSLHGILSDVCKNTQNRAEVISILLSILQDGTLDVGAVERSFAQLSLRAKQSAGSKTPQPTKRALTDVAPATELSPLNIVQQCLGTLNALSVDNPKVQAFFLSEHDTITSQKAKSAKKGKGKESKAARYPLNALLTLLDRKVITENTGVMEMLAALLSRVTHPLNALKKKPKETAEKEPEPQDAPAAEQPQATASDVPMAEDAAGPAEAVTTDTEAVAASGEASEPKKADVQTEQKKKRELEPPEVPEENIRLVINILASRECPSKTFSDTLDIIRHLTAIPGARDVFGKELIRRAQELGHTIVTDLEDLGKQIGSAKTGVDLQGMALAKFSSSGSDQRKLLQVLIALDHLFDPKRMQGSQASADGAVDPKLKEDILSTLSESTTFEKLWRNLSFCLAAIRRRGNMINVATILLPLIESLFVVCRNNALKEVTNTAANDAVVGTPPPETRMEGLFFTFTEEHRKILNELIRNNPKLMNGNLSILAQNSKVLEFDNKRAYFNRKLHTRDNRGQSHPALGLNVRREQVFLDSYKSLYYKSGEEIKNGKLNIRFNGEEGIDAGGVSREWFAVMARQMFNPDYALFNPVASDRTTFHPNRLSGINVEHLSFFKFIGRVIGKALYEGRVLDCHFSRAVYRRILGKSVSLKDMETLDLDYYRSLVWILENDITDVTFETFSVDIDNFGVTETVDLIPDGRNIPVTQENKQEYVRLVVEHRLVESVKKQLEAFLGGFHDIIPSHLVSIFNEQELELLISGLPEIDVDDWKNNTEYHNYQATSPQIQWLWRAIKSFDPEERAKLLQFVTGTSKVPLNGFKELEGMNGFAKFNIHRDYSSKERLPTSHTCFNQLDLPEYDSYEALRQQLHTAITAGSEYFGFA